MEYFYVVTSASVKDVEELNSKNLNKRKIGPNSWAVQIWSTEKQAYEFVERYFSNVNLKPFRVEKSVLFNIMQNENMGTKVELDAEII